MAFIHPMTARYLAAISSPSPWASSGSFKGNEHIVYNMQAEGPSQGPGRHSEKTHLLEGYAPTPSGNSTPKTTSMFPGGRQFKFADNADDKEIERAPEFSPWS